MIPYYPDDEGDTVKFEVETRAEKWVADYCNISIFDVGAICYYDYRVLLRDAVIHSLSQTQSGREYLNNAWILTQTKPDRAALRKKYGREEGTDGE